METTSASFQTHSSCEACGSSDAKAIYDDGHAYCFSCNTYYGGEDQEHNSTPTEFSKTTAANNQAAQAVYSQGKIQELKSRNISADTARHFGYKVGSGRHLAPYLFVLIFFTPQWSVVYA